jgi:hypothetical protein
MRAARGAIQQTVRVARQLTLVPAPGEQRTCPACAAARLKYMMPLAFAAPPVAHDGATGSYAAAGAAGCCFRTRCLMSSS